MTVASPIKTNFTAGELSPRLDARVDLSKYGNGAATLKNFVVQPHGGATFRSGFRYVADVKTHADKVRLVAFEFSTTQAYIIEFGDLYMRFYYDEGQVESGGSPYEVVTTYAKADLFELNFAQSADVLYVAHPTYPPRKITRTAHDAWTIADIAFTANPFTGAGDYPAAVALYEERSVWAGSDNDPQKMWFSQTGSFEDMTVGVADDDGMEYTISSDQVNRIRWLNPGDTLLIGTVGGEFEAHGSSHDQPITPTTIQVNRQTTYGSAAIQPVRIGAQVLFVQRAKRKIRELVYSVDSESYVAPDMTILSEHITKGGITEIAYQQEPDSTIWCIRSDGYLLGMTYERPQDVVGWHIHTLGREGTDTAESVAVIPSPSGDHDQVWVSGTFSVDGSTKRYVCFMEEQFDADEVDQEDAFFLDCALTYDSTPVTTISGLDHLEGETVSVLADGATHPTKVVASGSITLDRSSSVVHVGLPYTGTIKTLRADSGGQRGTSQGKITRIHKCGVRFFSTLGAKIGSDTGDMEIIQFRDGSDPMDAPPPLYTGDKVVALRHGYDLQPQVIVQQDQPLPCTVLSVMPDQHVYET